MVINELPIGSIVRFGRFMPVNSADLTNIKWIKVSNDNHFISKKVLIGAAFDAYELNWMSNNDYSLSDLGNAVIRRIENVQLDIISRA